MSTDPDLERAGIVARYEGAVTELQANIDWFPRLLRRPLAWLANRATGTDEFHG